MKYTKAFTLIELVIVVAIIGTLAAISVQLYQGYVVKSQINRVVSESSLLRGAVENCLLESKLILGASVGQCNVSVSGSNLMVGNSQIGAALPPGMGVPQLTTPLSSTSTITSTFGNNASPALVAANARIVWSRTTAGSWSCSAPGVPATFSSSSCPCKNSLLDVILFA